MAKSQIIAGIEIGSSKIVTLIAQTEEEPVSLHTKVNVVGVSSVESKGIKKGQIVDIDEAVEATIASVERAERMAGYNLDRAYIAIGGAHIDSQNSHGVVAVSDPDKEVSETDVDRVIEAASAVSMPSSREVIHVIPREFIVDGESGVKVPLGMSGVRLEVHTHLVTASSAAIKNLQKAVNEVGVDIEGFVFSGIAAARSVLTKTEKELGCVLIDVGGGMTSIVAYIDGALSYSGVIPIGSKNVTNDLAIGLRVSLDNAEKIKVLLSNEKMAQKGKKLPGESDQMDLSKLGVDVGRKVSRKTLTEGIIRPRLNEIFSMVRLQLEKEKINTRIPSGAVITGGGAQIVGALDSAKRMLALPVRIGTPKGVGGLIDDVMEPSFASAVGLLLYAADQEPHTSGVGSISKRFKMPSGGLASKLFSSLKDLLP